MEKEKFIPFSNSTEFAIWQFQNCDKCTKYECESTTEKESGCVLAFNLDLASVGDGTIDIEIANKIGILNNKLTDCKEKDEYPF